MSTKSKRRSARRHDHHDHENTIPRSVRGEQPNAEQREVLGAVMGALLSALTFGAVDASSAPAQH